LLSKPNYQGSDALANDEDDATHWYDEYMKDVQRVQDRRQHHVHIPDDTGARQPLTHCPRSDNPTECKAGYPNTTEAKLLTEPVVVCHGIAKTACLPVTGARNALGRLLGTRNDEWLNGTHPAMLAAFRCNSDVSVPYRLPITEDTHWDKCQCLRKS